MRHAVQHARCMRCNTPCDMNAAYVCGICVVYLRCMHDACAVRYVASVFHGMLLDVPHGMLQGMECCMDTVRHSRVGTRQCQH